MLRGLPGPAPRCAQHSGDRPVHGQQTIGVIRKGTGEYQELPANRDAFVWLRLYQEDAWNARSKYALDRHFSLPDAATPAMRAHTELVDEPRVLISQPVTDTLLYVHIRLGRNDAGLHTWLRRIGLKREQATRTEHGDYLARGQLNGARIMLIAHAHSYR
jgi:hypothetical protein